MLTKQQIAEKKRQLYEMAEDCDECGPIDFIDELELPPEERCQVFDSFFE